MHKVAIVGATGYAGAELLRLLMTHPQVEVKHIVAKLDVGKKYDDLFCNFKHFRDDKCLDVELEAIAGDVDCIFLALPHGLASKWVNKEVLSKTKIVDFGADFRLKSKSIYEKWYKTQHYNESLLSEAIYGLCELKREEIKKGRLIANPGCYTTCSILAVYPLLKEGLIQEDSIIVDAKTGISGGGRVATNVFSFCEVNESFKAYSVVGHRHTPEIEQLLTEAAGREITITFTPHLAPMNRGILATCYAKLKQKTDYDTLRAAFEKYYGNEYFIRLLNKDVFPETRWTVGSNFYDLGFTIDERTQRVVILGALDNLVKGAAGQAVQNMNIILGLEETMGLKMPPLFPS